MRIPARSGNPLPSPARAVARAPHHLTAVTASPPDSPAPDAPAPRRLLLQARDRLADALLLLGVVDHRERLLVGGDGAGLVALRRERLGEAVLRVPRLRVALD